MFGIKSILRGNWRGMREREGRVGDKELPSALLLSGGKEGRGRQLHHQPLLCQEVRLYNSTQILATAPASLKYEDCRFWRYCKT